MNDINDNRPKQGKVLIETAPRSLVPFGIGWEAPEPEEIRVDGLPEGVVCAALVAEVDAHLVVRLAYGDGRLEERYLLKGPDGVLRPIDRRAVIVPLRAACGAAPTHSRSSCSGRSDCPLFQMPPRKMTYLSTVAAHDEAHSGSESPA